MISCRPARSKISAPADAGMAGMAGVGPSGESAWALSRVTTATLRRNVRCTARRPGAATTAMGESAPTAQNAKPRGRVPAGAAGKEPKMPVKRAEDNK